MENRCVYWGRAGEAVAEVSGAGTGSAAATTEAATEEEPACESKAEDSAVPLCTLGTEEADPFGAERCF